MRNLIKKILLLAVLSSPLGAATVAIHTPIGGFSIFRVAILLALVLDLALNSGKVRTRYYGENSYSIRFMGILFAYAIISGIWAVSKSDWVRNIFFLFIALLSTLLFESYMSDEEDFFSVLSVFNIGILVQAIIGWTEVITKVYLFRDIESGISYRFIVGNFGMPVAMQFNPNNFALLMFFGAGIAYICYSRAKKLKHFYIICAANYIVLLCLTTSRAAILALFIAIAFLFLKSGKRSIALILLSAVIVFAFPQTIDFIQDKMQFHFSTGSGSDVTRINLIKNGFYFLLETMGFGVGAGQISAWMGTRAKYSVGVITPMHNWWMEMLTSYGVLIFIGYLRFYLGLFRSYYRAIHRDNVYRGTLGVVICALMVGYIFGGVGPSSTMSFEWLWCFWSICIVGQRMIVGDVSYSNAIDW